MSALDILAGLENGRPGSERLSRLQARIAELDRKIAPGALLDVLCSLPERELWGFVGNVRGMPESVRNPRGLDHLVNFVEDLASGALKCRVELRDDPFESRLMPQNEMIQARKKFGLAADAWSDEAEAEARRLHKERDRPLVLYLAGSHPAAGIRDIVEAVARNEARAAFNRVRRAFIDKCRLGVLAKREAA